jgi:hypothetical protein
VTQDYDGSLHEISSCTQGLIFYHRPEQKSI